MSIVNIFICYNIFSDEKGEAFAYMKYVKRIRDLREDHNLTQQQIADVLGTSQTMYARYERGANELPIHHLLTLGAYYRVSADYILGFSEREK